MIITMILIFVFGYLCIALEHKLRIDKAAIALLMCGALWTVLSLLGNGAQIGTQWGARLRAEQLRILLAPLVLAVCGKLALDLFLRPDDLYSITPGILK